MIKRANNTRRRNWWQPILVLLWAGSLFVLAYFLVAEGPRIMSMFFGWAMPPDTVPPLRGVSGTKGRILYMIADRLGIPHQTVFLFVVWFGLLAFTYYFANVLRRR